MDWTFSMFSFRMSSFLYLTGIDSFRLVHKMLRDPSPKFDEHTTERERYSRFSDKNYAMGYGEIVVDGWRPIF